jgi:hypothetical protein
MKLAKKTLSVALAAVMAASSLAGAATVFAQDSVLPSAPSYTAVSVGTTKVTPNVKIDTQYATKNASDLSKQIDSTTLSNYYSFTPAKTGKYTLSVNSTALYHGYDKKAYDAKIASHPTFNNMNAEQQAQIIAAAKEAAYVWSNSYEGLYADSDFTTEITKDNYTSYIQDKVVVNNVNGEDAFLSGVGSAVTSEVSTTDEYVLSYKYDSEKKAVVEDKKVTLTSTGATYSTVETYLKKGTTYKFVVTVADQDTLVTSKEVKNTSGEVTAVQAVKTNAPATASFTIAAAGDEVSYDTTYEAAKDAQKVTVPYNFSGATYDSKTKTYYVEKKVYEAKVTATNNSTAATVKVEDTYKGAKVTAFVNNSMALQTLTLGKYVDTIGDEYEGIYAPYLKKVVITNPDYEVSSGDFESSYYGKELQIVAPANSIAYKTAVAAGYQVTAACTHVWKVTKAATIFATGVKTCTECDATATIAKVKFAPTAKASKKKIVVKGNAGKVAKLAVWVYDSKGNLVKKQVKKNVTKNTVKVAKAGKYTVKVKAYGTNGAKTASVKKTVKVK